MKPAPFVYFEPTSVHEALSLLLEHAPDAQLLAGGQSLVPAMNFRLSRPAVIIDLNSIPDLAYIRDLGGHLLVGAMTRQRVIENSRLIRAAAPLLYQATVHIGHLPIRNRGTIGGSLAHADPAAEYPAAVLALDCEMIVARATGERRIPAEEFFAGALSTVMEPDELLLGLVVPKAPAHSGSAFAEIARRHGDFALSGVAAQVVLSGDSVVAVQLAACGVDAGPVRLAAAESAVLAGGTCAASIKASARLAAGEVEPETDLHGSADYRRRLTAAMTQRALASAVESARLAA